MSTDKSTATGPPREPAILKIRPRTVDRMWPAVRRLDYGSAQRCLSAIAQSMANIEDSGRKITAIQFVIEHADGSVKTHEVATALILDAEAQ